MPRPKNILLQTYYSRNKSKEIICNNDNCANKVLNSHSGNLERHLKMVHPNIYKNYIYKKNNTKQMKGNGITNAINKKNIQLAIVELFTKNARPLQMAEDRAFKILVKPVFDAVGIIINEHNINERILAFAQQIKIGIVNDIKGKLLSLKIDAATRRNLSVLAFNVQYIKNGQIEIKTLAVKEIKSSCTNDYLKSLILEVLAEYSIDISQILTITTDNGANMLKDVKDLNLELQNIMEEDTSNIEDNDEEKDSESETTEETMKSNNYDLQNITEEDKIENNNEEKDSEIEITEETLKSIRSYFALHCITGVRCGPHILELCVYDVLNTPEVKAALDKCRSVVKQLRTPNYMNIFKNGRYKKPILDCVTRWNSTFIMIERLVEMRNIIQTKSSESPCLYLSSDDWKFAEQFIETFKAVYDATLKLQMEQLCFSELYIIIMDIIFKLDTLPINPMSIALKNSLNSRKFKLFDIELFNASVYLDPRIKVCMNAEQKDRAMKYITTLYQWINTLKDSKAPDMSIKDESLESPPTSNNPATYFIDSKVPENSIKVESMESLPASNNSATPFYEFLENLYPLQTEPFSSSLSDIETDLILYNRQPRLPLQSNVIQFWSSQNNTLSCVANIILAIPCTQVSVERLVSAMKYILSDERNRLTDSSVEHILLVKLNGVFDYDN